MSISDLFWEDSNGEWTIASLLVREFYRAEKFTNELGPEELYYILHTLDIKERFAEYWDYPEFYERMGIKHGRYRIYGPGKKGDYAWAVGDLEGALRYYEESIRNGGHPGYAGKLRLCFCQRQFDECVDIFKKVCPPHSFYQEYQALLGRTGGDDFDFNKETNAVERKYKKKSPYFISSSEYMLQVIVFSSAHLLSADSELHEMISDYFEVSREEIDELAVSLYQNEKEFYRLKKRIEPKPVKTDGTISGSIKRGCTKRAEELCRKLLNYKDIIKETQNAVVNFLQQGREEVLDQIINIAPPFGIGDADAIIFRNVFAPILRQISELPKLQLVLMRRFNPICGYPEGMSVWHEDSQELLSEGDFVDVYRAIMLDADYEILSSDILLCMMNINWYEEALFVDLVFIRKHFEWCSILLERYIDAFDRTVLRDRSGYIVYLYEAYKYLLENYEDVKNKQAWVNEDLLAKAIKRLFGKDKVQQHARPIWLSPQHLDIYLPTYSLAIEYMGKQHYEAVEYFGGEKALTENKIRDERKAELCARRDVKLIYVTYNEDVGKRAREIFEMYNSDTQALENR